jgi:protein-disulfide isomerase
MPLLTRRHLLAGCAAGAALALGPLPALAQARVDLDDLLAPGPLGDKVLGAEDAPIVVVEYASMSCPFCARFHRDTMQAYLEKYVETGQVRHVFREFPLDAPAYAVSMLARCAPEDRFFDLVNVYFERQEQWLRSPDMYNAILDIARQFGFSQESFDACLENQALFDGLEEVKNRAAQRFGVTGTPTFFIEGRRQSGALTLDQLDSLIQPHLSPRPRPPPPRAQQ